MKKLLLIYNAHAGNRHFKNHLDRVLQVFSASFYVSVLRVEAIQQIDDYLNQLADTPAYFDTVVAAGGDGTLNCVVSAVLRHGLQTRIGIIPAGTSNDFARAMHIPKQVVQAAKIIAHGDTTCVDIGQITNAQGKHYFVNVFGAGTLTNISYHVDPNLKNTLGNMAYYLKALEKLGEYTPIPVTITNSTEIMETEILFMVALNTGGAGGFDSWVPDASTNDGLFDFLAIKPSSIPDAMGLIMKFFRGEHLQDERLIYYRDSYTQLTLGTPTETNIDGETGPLAPLSIDLLPQAVTIHVPTAAQIAEQNKLQILRHKILHPHDELDLNPTDDTLDELPH